MGSTLGSRYMAATVWAILSATVGTPSIRTAVPDFFGISTALTGGGKYVPELIRFQSLYRLFFNSGSNSWRDCPSTPPAPSLALTLRYASHTTCFEIANGFGLGLAAGSSCLGSCPPSKTGWPVPFARPALPGVITTAEQSATACPRYGTLLLTDLAAWRSPSCARVSHRPPRSQSRGRSFPRSTSAPEPGSRRLYAGCRLGRKQVPPRLVPSRSAVSVSASLVSLSTRLQRFARARLPGSHLTLSWSAVSATFTTPAMVPAQLAAVWNLRLRGGSAGACPHRQRSIPSDYVYLHRLILHIRGTTELWTPAVREVG